MRFIKILFVIIMTLIYISSSSATYFIDIDIPIGYLSVKPGDRIDANIKIIAIDEEKGRKDYNIKAYIFDKEGNKITEKSKVIAIENEVSTTISFNLPSNIKPGEYKMEVDLNGIKKSVGFIVEDVKEYNISIVYILLLIFVGFFIVFFIYDRKLNKYLKHMKKVSGRDITKKR